MTYTVKQLANVSGVSSRTLHWYDEIGLLKPAHIGANGYRYYEDEQLLLLQQILFYKEMGFALGEIQALLANKERNNLEALLAHRERMHKKLGSLGKMIKTIDQTISHIKGETNMTHQDFFECFDKEKVESFEKRLVASGGKSIQRAFDEARTNTKKWNRSDWFRLKDQGDNIYAALTDCINKNLSVDSDRVQRLIKQHYDMLNSLYTPTKEVYLGLADLYVSEGEYVEYFNAFHQQLAGYLAAAIKIFVSQKT